MSYITSVCVCENETPDYDDDYDQACGSQYCRSISVHCVESIACVAYISDGNCPYTSSCKSMHGNICMSDDYYPMQSMS